MSEIRIALLSGYNAYYVAFSTGFFGADHRPQWTPNPYTVNPAKDLWLRGWREAEKAFISKGQYLQVNPFETVTGLRDAARYYETKARSKAQKKRDTTKSPVFAAPYGKQAQQIVRAQKPKNGPINLKQINRFNKKHRTVA